MPESVALDLHLDLRRPEQHLVRATLRWLPRTTTIRLRLPGWTPGSYLIRDYVRTLEGLEARLGSTVLQPRRLSPACWQLELPEGCAGSAALEVSWRILATELSVRTCHLSADHGFLALAGVVPLVEGERWSPHRLHLSLPPGWHPFLPLPADEAAAGSWLARDYDQLVDSPLEAGPHPCRPFAVAGVPHRWVGWGEDLPGRDPAWLADVERVCLACCRLMGESRPASSDYLFVLHLRERGFGGLEHDDASVLLYGRTALAEPDGRRRLLQLVAHEYLHQWNVRRLRPVEICPVDYDRPTILPTLWFAEGVTSYYDQLLPLAAGLSDEAALLADLGADLSRYRLTPGRRIQSLRQSSEEAWVKLYRPDPHSPDCQISYYLKGAVVALCLDLHLRRHGSALSLVLRDLWRSHGRHGRGYTAADLVDAFRRHAADLSTLLPLWLESGEDPPMDGYLADVGLQLVAESAGHADAGWRFEEGSSCLSRVVRGGAAERCGLQVGDEILAIDGQRLRGAEEARRLLRVTDPAAATARHTLHYCHDGLLRQTLLQPDPAAVERWSLRIDAEAPAGAAGRRARWLSLEP